MLEVQFGEIVAGDQADCWGICALAGDLKGLLAFTVSQHALVEEAFLQEDVAQELLLLFAQLVDIG